MAGITLVTNQDASTAMENVKKVGRRLGYAVTDVNEFEVALQKGNAIAGIFLGAIFPHYIFRVVVRKNPDKTVEIDIERNNPRFTGGALAVGRIKSHAQEVADKIAEAIVEQRGEILRRAMF